MDSLTNIILTDKAIQPIIDVLDKPDWLGWLMLVCTIINIIAFIWLTRGIKRIADIQSYNHTSLECDNIRLQIHNKLSRLHGELSKVQDFHAGLLYSIYKAIASKDDNIIREKKRELKSIMNKVSDVTIDSSFISYQSVQSMINNIPDILRSLLSYFELLEEKIPIAAQKDKKIDRSYKRIVDLAWQNDEQRMKHIYEAGLKIEASTYEDFLLRRYVETYNDVFVRNNILYTIRIECYLKDLLDKHNNL